MDDGDLIKMLEKRRTERKQARTMRSVEPRLYLGEPASPSQTAERDRVIERQLRVIAEADARAVQQRSKIKLAQAMKREAFAREKAAKEKAEREMRERSEKARAEQKIAREKLIEEMDFAQDDPDDDTYDDMFAYDPDDWDYPEIYKNLRF